MDFIVNSSVGGYPRIVRLSSANIKIEALKATVRSVFSLKNDTDLDLLWEYPSVGGSVAISSDEDLMVIKDLEEKLYKLRFIHSVNILGEKT